MLGMGLSVRCGQYNSYRRIAAGVLVLVCTAGIAYGTAAVAYGGNEPGEARTFAGIEFVWIPPGTFFMGNDEGQESERPRHKVTLTKGFWLGKYEVTKRQWVAVMRADSWRVQMNVINHPDSPAVCLERREAYAFIRKLNTWGAGTFRLPTEAEWERACRAGSDAVHLFDEDGDVDDYAWHWLVKWGHYGHVVGQKKPNAWGLHDMMGNVWEYCRDAYSEDYFAVSPEVDPRGPAPDGAVTPLVKGGSFKDYPEDLRSCLRGVTHQDGYSKRRFRLMTSTNLGFRLAMSADAAPEGAASAKTTAMTDQEFDDTLATLARESAETYPRTPLLELWLAAVVCTLIPIRWSRLRRLLRGYGTSKDEAGSGEVPRRPWSRDLCYRLHIRLCLLTFLGIAMGPVIDAESSAHLHGEFAPSHWVHRQLSYGGIRLPDFELGLFIGAPLVLGSLVLISVVAIQFTKPTWRQRLIATALGVVALAFVAYHGLLILGAAQ